MPPQGAAAAAAAVGVSASMASPLHKRSSDEILGKTEGDFTYLQKEVTPDPVTKVQQKPIVDTIWFQVSITAMVFLNTVQMGIEADNPDLSLWVVTENFFTAVFFIEMIIKISVLKCLYFHDKANWLDLTLTLLGVMDCWILSMLPGDSLDLQSMSILRILRLARLGRVVRLARRVKQFVLVISGVYKALVTTFWVFLLLVFVMYVCAIFCTEYIGRGAVESFPGYTEVAEEIDEQEVMQNFNPFICFGSMQSSMLTLFNIAIGGEWQEIVRPMAVKQPWMAILFIIYAMLIAFGVMNVMIGIVVDSVIAESKLIDKEMQDRQKQTKRKLLSRIQTMLESMDTNKDEVVDLKELEASFENGKSSETPNELQTMLGQCDLPAGWNAKELLYMLDNSGDGVLQKAEFTTSFFRLMDSDDFQQICIMQASLNQVKHLVRQAHDKLEIHMAEMRQSLRQIQTVEAEEFKDIAVPDPSQVGQDIKADTELDEDSDMGEPVAGKGSDPDLEQSADAQKRSLEALAREPRSKAKSKPAKEPAEKMKTASASHPQHSGMWGAFKAEVTELAHEAEQKVVGLVHEAQAEAEELEKEVEELDEEPEEEETALQVAEELNETLEEERNEARIAVARASIRPNPAPTPGPVLAAVPAPIPILAAAPAPAPAPVLAAPPAPASALAATASAFAPAKLIGEVPTDKFAFPALRKDPLIAQVDAVCQEMADVKSIPYDKFNYLLDVAFLAMKDSLNRELAVITQRSYGEDYLSVMSPREDDTNGCQCLSADGNASLDSSPEAYSTSAVEPETEAQPVEVAEDSTLALTESGDRTKQVICTDNATIAGGRDSQRPQCNGDGNSDAIIGEDFASVASGSHAGDFRSRDYTNHRQNVDQLSSFTFQTTDGSSRAYYSVEVRYEDEAKLGFEIQWFRDPTELPLIGAVLPGGASDVRGVLQGDELVHCNGIDIIGRSRPEVLLLLQQRPLVLSLRRGGEMI